MIGGVKYQMILPWKENKIEHNLVFFDHPSHVMRDHLIDQDIPLDPLAHYYKFQRICQHIDTSKYFLFVVHFRNDFQDFPYDYIDRYRAHADKHDLEFRIVIYEPGEAPTYRWDMRQVIDNLRNNHGIGNKIIFMTGAQHQFDDPIVNSICYDAIGHVGIWDSIRPWRMPTHHFISLARRARPHRIVATVEMLDRQLDGFGHMSLGAAGDNSCEPMFRYLIPDRYNDRFPIVLDHENVTQDLIHDITDDRITDAFVNVIMETSFERYPWNSVAWNVPFMTEKTSKAFLLRQVPIMISHRHSLSFLREHGFDLFDDIIDHSYDNETCPETRIKMAIDQLESICSKDITYWQDYKMQNRDRFDRNNDIIRSMIIDRNLNAARNLRNALKYASNKKVWKVDHRTHNSVWIETGIYRADQYTYVSQVLDRCDISRFFLFILDQTGLCNGGRFPEEFLPEFQKHAADNDLIFVVVYVNLQEAPTYLYTCKTVIDSVSRRFNIPLERMIFFSGAQHQFDTPVQNALTLKVAAKPHLWINANPFGDHAQHRNRPSHHFISLARHPKFHRIAATVELLDRGLQDLGYMSLGSTENRYFWENLSAVPVRYHHLMPMILDHRDVQEQDIYGSTDDRMVRAFANLVMESSYEEKPWGTSLWNVPFMTEKTMKPFIWGQVPVFLAHQHSLKFLRDWGFDLFEDIVDHSYDCDPDSSGRRVVLAIDQLEKICKMPIEHWQQYKIDNMDRFKHNDEMARKVMHEQELVAIPNFRKALENTYPAG